MEEMISGKDESVVDISRPELTVYRTTISWQRVPESRASNGEGAPTSRTVLVHGMFRRRKSEDWVD
jgi:hypothetical protein